MVDLSRRRSTTTSDGSMSSSAPQPNQSDLIGRQLLVRIPPCGFHFVFTIIRNEAMLPLDGTRVPPGHVSKGGLQTLNLIKSVPAGVEVQSHAFPASRFALYSYSKEMYCGLYGPSQAACNAIGVLTEHNCVWCPVDGTCHYTSCALDEPR